MAFTPAGEVSCCLQMCFEFSHFRMTSVRTLSHRRQLSIQGPSELRGSHDLLSSVRSPGPGGNLLSAVTLCAA